MSFNGSEKLFHTSCIPSGHCHMLNFCMASSKQCLGLLPSIPQLPSSCHSQQCSSPCCTASSHRSPSASSSPRPLLTRTISSINYDIRRLAMTLSFLWAQICLLHLKESMNRFSSGIPLCLHSQVVPCALQHTVVSCCIILYVCLCCVGKKQSFK